MEESRQNSAVTCCVPSLSKPLGQSRKDRPADAELRSADAHPGAVADFVDTVTDVQNVEAKFGPLPDPKIELLNDAGIDRRIFPQGRAISHRWRAGTQAALRDEVHSDTGLVFCVLVEGVGYSG